MKRILSICILLSTILILFTGCTSPGAQEVKQMKPLTFDEIVRNRVQSASADEKEAIIYQYVTDRLTIDTDALLGITDEETEVIRDILYKVNVYLQGDPLKEAKGVLDPIYANYLLMEFTKTPYVWEQDRVEILGFDPATRRYFVDVFYKTTDKKKPVIDESTIPAGSPDADILLESRYTQYMSYLDTKFNEETGRSTNGKEPSSIQKQKFEERWGNIELLLETQNGLTLLERTRKNLGKDFWNNVMSGGMSESDASDYWENLKSDIEYQYSSSVNAVDDSDIFSNDFLNSFANLTGDSNDDASKYWNTLYALLTGGKTRDLDIDSFNQFSESIFNSTSEVGRFQVQTPVISEAEFYGVEGNSVPDTLKFLLPQASQDIISKGVEVQAFDIGGVTYSGLVTSNSLSDHAEMSVRYVLSYTFNLGERRELKVDTLYVKDYITEDKFGYRDLLVDEKTISGIEVMKPILDRNILAYNRAVDESNDIGLYKLYLDYGGVDKYYSDLRAYSYMKHMAYTYRVLSRVDGIITVRVDQTRKYRAKGSGISFPMYDEVLLFTFGESDNDTLDILNVEYLKSEMVGEPLNVIQNVVGVSEKMLFSEESFTQENESKIIQLLKDFSVVQLQGGVSNENFLNIVDTGIASAELNRMIEIMDSVTALNSNEKCVFLSGYLSKSNVFVSLKIRELFAGEEIFDTEAIIDLVNRDGKWKIVGYRRTLNIKVTGNVSRNGSIFYTKKDGTVTDTPKRVVSEDAEEQATTAETTTAK